MEDANLGLKPAAARLGVSEHTLRYWAVYQRRIPYFKLGRRLVFSRRDLEVFEQRSRVEAIPR
jgi:DNA-binding transcriptional MerR regulator